MSRKIVNIDYDPEADVLYICLVPGVPSYIDEEEEGILIRKSIKDGQLTGITIIDFKERYMDSSLNSVRLPVAVDFDDVGKRLFS